MRVTQAGTYTTLRGSFWPWPSTTTGLGGFMLSGAAPCTGGQAGRGGCQAGSLGITWLANPKHTTIPKHLNPKQTTKPEAPTLGM